MSSLEDTDAADGVGTLPYMVKWNGKHWVRFTYDSGASTTAFPIETAGDKALEQAGSFVVASGGDIPHFGKGRFAGIDEKGNRRGIGGTVAGVHKPLAAASDLARSHDGFLWEDGGALIPRKSPIALKMRQYYQQLVAQHGDDHILRLHREGGLYNFYLEYEAPLEMAAVEKPWQAVTYTKNGRLVKP